MSGLVKTLSWLAMYPGEHMIILHIDTFNHQSDEVLQRETVKQLPLRCRFGIPKKLNISPLLHLLTVDIPVKTSLEAKSKSTTKLHPQLRSPRRLSHTASTPTYLAKALPNQTSQLLSSLHIRKHAETIIAEFSPSSLQNITTP